MLTTTYSESRFGPLLLDLYRPPSPASAPVVVWLHGGGWFTGDRTLAPDPQPLLDHGIAFAAIEYRLSGEALFPAQLHDVRAAIRYLRREAPVLGLDGARIAVWGSSAGGHLAALAGLTGGVDQLTGELESGDASVCAVADAYGPATLVPGAVQEGAAPPNGAPPEWRLIGGDPAQHLDLARTASPLEVLGESSTGAADLPPFQLAHGTADAMVPPEHSMRLYEALTAKGASVELFLVEGYRHGFLNPGGRPDLPAGMDDGRLGREGGAPARRSSDGETSDTTFTFGTTIEFFSRAFVPTGDHV